MKNSKEKITKSSNIPFMFTREEVELYIKIKNRNKDKEGI